MFTLLLLLVARWRAGRPGVVVPVMGKVSVCERGHWQHDDGATPVSVRTIDVDSVRRLRRRLADAAVARVQ